MASGDIRTSYEMVAQAEVSLVRAKGAMGFVEWRGFKRAFDGARARGKPITVCVRDVTKLDSFGLGALLLHIDRSKKAGLKVRIEGCKDGVRDLFHLGGICRQCANDDLAFGCAKGMRA